MEHQLLKLEDVVEEQELQEQMLNERFQLAVYRSKRLKELEKISGKKLMDIIQLQVFDLIDVFR